MAVRPVVLSPDPRLKRACAPVTAWDDALHALIGDLWDTLAAGPPRTVGIAAPQIGVLQRVAIVDVARNPKYPPGHGPLTLVNPTITGRAGEQMFREGCLSVPAFTANIRRAQWVRVEAFDAEGQPLTVEAEGFESVVLQHEIDHLDGILFLDRVLNVKTDLFRRSELAKKG